MGLVKALWGDLKPKEVCLSDDDFFVDRAMILMNDFNE